MKLPGKSTHPGRNIYDDSLNEIHNFLLTDQYILNCSEGTLKLYNMPKITLKTIITENLTLCTCMCFKCSSDYHIIF